MEERKEERKGISKGLAQALIVLQSVIYGFGDPISKIAFDVVPVYAMMTVRYSIAFAVCFLLFHKRIIKTVKTVPLKAWLIPGVCIGMSYLLNNVALSMTEATSVAFIRSMSVIITPALAFLMFGKKYRWQQLLAQILVLPGIYLLCVKGGLSGFGAGEIVTLAAATLTAATLVLSGKYLEQVDPISLTALMGIILYLAILCTFLGYLMQNLALTGISERSVSLIQSLCPVMTAIFSFILLGERLSAAGVIGAAIIILCSLSEAWNWKSSSNDQEE